MMCTGGGWEGEDGGGGRLQSGAAMHVLLLPLHL